MKELSGVLAVSGQCEFEGQGCTFQPSLPALVFASLKPSRDSQTLVRLLTFRRTFIVLYFKDLGECYLLIPKIG